MNVPQFRQWPNTVFLLISIALIASISVVCSGQTPAIKGVKIKKSTFDPQTKKVELVFINDRAADITAYHYCLIVESTDPEMSRRECELIDTLSSVLDWKANTK